MLSPNAVACYIRLSTATEWNGNGIDKRKGEARLA
jgi:hypothetical protein